MKLHKQPLYCLEQIEKKNKVVKMFMKSLISVIDTKDVKLITDKMDLKIPLNKHMLYNMIINKFESID